MDSTVGCQTVKVPEKLGGVGSFWGMKMGRSEDYFPPDHKRE